MEEVLPLVMVYLVEDLLWSSPDTGSLGLCVDRAGAALVLPKTSGKCFALIKMVV